MTEGDDDARRVLEPNDVLNIVASATLLATGAARRRVGSLDAVSCRDPNYLYMRLRPLRLRWPYGRAMLWKPAVRIEQRTVEQRMTILEAMQKKGKRRRCV